MSKITNFMFRRGTVLGGSLLIAGTSIGAGMLALPVLTGPAGFRAAILIYFICWAFMVATGLLFLEVSLSLKKDNNIISMSSATLGPIAKAIVWVLYIFLFYTLNVAYISGSKDFLGSFFPTQYGHILAPIIFVGFFGSLVFIGTYLVDKVNSILMIGLIISYILFFIFGVRYINIEYLMRSDWSKSMLVLPIAFASFGYQGTIPTLITYLDRDVKKIRRSIIIGASIPFLIYVIWEFLILGIIPFEGEHGLKGALDMQHSAIPLLKHALNNDYIYLVGLSFAFCSLVSSFLGVSLGVRDFLADGLKIEKSSLSGRLSLIALIFLPPLIIALLKPHIFLTSLNLGGGIGCALLLGLLPILMVWSLRYKKRWKSPYRFPGGKITLTIMAIFVTLEVSFEIIKLIGG